MCSRLVSRRGCSRPKSGWKRSSRRRRWGLRGVDFSTDPYDTEADPTLWAVISAGPSGRGRGTGHHGPRRGVLPGQPRGGASRPGSGSSGHAVHAASDPRLLDPPGPQWRRCRVLADQQCGPRCGPIL